MGGPVSSEPEYSSRMCTKILRIIPIAAITMGHEQILAAIKDQPGSEMLAA